MYRIITLLLLGFSVSLAQTHQHAATSTGDGQFNPFVATDNRGGFYLAYVERTNNVSNVMLRHTNDGVTFSRPIRVNDRLGAATVRNENPPKVLVGAERDVYICWADEREKWKGNLRFAVSTDGGKSFSQSMTINSDADGPPAGHAFQSMAADHQGKIYVAWIDERNMRQGDRGAEIWLASSTDRGRTFSKGHRILSDVCECCRTNLQIDSQGKVYLAYRTVPGSGPMYRDIIVAHSHDGGSTFRPTVVSQDRWDVNGCPVAGPSLSIDSSDRLTVIWFKGGSSEAGLYYSTSTDKGASFAPRQWLTREQKMGKHAHAAVTNNDEMLVVWDDVENQQPLTAWGLLDVRTQLLRVLGRQAGASYPVVSVSSRAALVVASQSGERNLFTKAIALNASQNALKR